jgi:sulfite exporter TauE/SafE
MLSLLINRKADYLRIIKVIVVILCLISISVGLKIFYKIDVLVFIKNLFYLNYLPKLTTNAGFGLLLLFGILTSFHCIGMCGGIVLTQCVKKTGNDDPGKKSHLMILPAALYNVGRIISYTIVGGVVGGVGQILTFSGVMMGVIPIIGGLFMIVMAVNLLGIFPVLRWLQIGMPKSFVKKVMGGNNYSPIIVGLLTGLMPCGPLQIVQLYALSTRSVLYGAASMFVFALGTAPGLFTFGAVSSIINQKYSKSILKASAVFVAIIGIVMIGRGLALEGIALPSFTGPANAADGYVVSVARGPVQTVTTTIGQDYFPPIQVQKGIRVIWTIRVPADVYCACNKTMEMPAYHIEKKFAIGDNIVEFLPDQEGDFVYTCWMGMIKSKIRVVADNATSPAGITASETATEVSRSVSPSSGASADPGAVNSAGGAAGVPASVNPRPAVQTFTGYITSEDDFVEPLYQDTAGMVFMRLMARSGLGVTFKQPDGTWMFYYFDGQIASGNEQPWKFNGTGAQLTAWNIVGTQVHGGGTKNPVPVTVTGTLNGNKETNPGPDADGRYFPVVTVARISAL